MSLPAKHGRGGVEALGEKMQKAIAAPWLYEGNHIEIRASIGVAIPNKHIDSAEELMKASDLALYAAKAAGRDSLRFFTPAMGESAHNKQNLLSDMRKAIQNNEFFVNYQPQISLKTGLTTGLEALVRWQHPVRGLISPLEFISIAEESGLIIPLGSWVLHQACKDAITWPQNLRVAVNISAVQIEQSDLISTIKNTLDRTGLAHERLELELTESTLVGDSDHALVFLHTVRAMSVRVALDDFGTGFSSLSYLRAFPLDKLKIDQSFVSLLDKDTDDKAIAIVETIVRLAQALNLETTAEGVETAAQQAALSHLGATCGQGYRYAKPMSAMDISAFIAHWQVSETA